MKIHMKDAGIGRLKALSRLLFIYALTFNNTTNIV